MAREPDVALLIMASGSFVAKHKLQQIKEDLRTQDFKNKDPFLRDHYVLSRKSRHQSQIQGEDLSFFFFVFV